MRSNAPCGRRSREWVAKHFPKLPPFLLILLLVQCGTSTSDSGSAKVIYPSQKEEYLRSVYNVHAQCWNVCPPSVIKPESREEVANYIRNAYSNNTSFTIRSGGHSYVCRGLEENLDLLDLSGINHRKLVEYDDAFEITFGAGNRAGEIAGPLLRRDLGIVTGECFTVGVGGLWTGPGVHPMYFADMTSLTHLKELVIISLSGSIVHIKKTGGAKFLDRSPYEKLNENEYFDALWEVFRTNKPRITDWVVTDFVYHIPKTFTVPESMLFVINSESDDLWKNIRQELILKKNDCMLTYYSTSRNLVIMSCFQSNQFEKLEVTFSTPEYHYSSNHIFDGPMRYYSTDLWFEEESDFVKAFDLWTSKMDDLKKVCDHIIIESANFDDYAFAPFGFSGVVHWKVDKYESANTCLYKAVEIENSIKDVMVGKVTSSDNLRNCFDANPLTASQLALRKKLDPKNILFDGYQQGENQMTCQALYSRPDSCTAKGIDFEDFAKIDGAHGWPSRQERFGFAIKDFAKNNISDFEDVTKIDGKLINDTATCPDTMKQYWSDLTPSDEMTKMCTENPCNQDLAQNSLVCTIAEKCAAMNFTTDCNDDEESYAVGFKVAFVAIVFSMMTLLY